MIRRHIGAPLIFVEILRSGGKIRLHLARWGLLFLTAVLLSLTWLHQEGEGRHFVDRIPVIFQVGAWFLLMLLLLMAICSVVMSFFEEREQSTFEVLLGTPLSSFGICFAKWMAVMLRTGLLLLVMMPFVGLLFAEGGLATEQVSATLFLMFCMAGFFAAIGVFCAVLNRKQGMAILQTVSFVILTGVLYGIFIEYLPVYLDTEYGYPFLNDILTSERRTQLASWRAFALLAEGHPAAMGAALSPILLAQGAIHATATLLLLWGASRLLRTVENAGGSGLFRGLFGRGRGQGGGNSLGRRSWERGECRPWLSSPYVWRGISARASSRSRRMRGTMHMGFVLVLLFFPYLVALGISSTQYAIHAADTLVAEGVLPGLPEGFPRSFGSKAHVDPLTMRVTYLQPRVSTRHFHVPAEVLDDIAVAWCQIVTTVLLGICLLIFPARMATAVPRERSAKRLSILLSTGMKDHALYAGFWYEELARWRGVFGALLVTFVFLALHVESQILGTVSQFQIFWVCTYFWGCMAMYFGLTSRTARTALMKLAACVVAFWGVIPLLSILVLKNWGGDFCMDRLFFWISVTNPLLQMISGGIAWSADAGFLEGVARGESLFADQVALITWLLFPMILPLAGVLLHGFCRGRFRRLAGIHA